MNLSLSFINPIYYHAVAGQGEDSVPNSGHQPEVNAHQPTLARCQEGPNATSCEDVKKMKIGVRIRPVKYREMGMH